MKIALLTEKYPPDAGGLAVSAARLAQGLAGARHAVQVFALAENLPAGQSAVNTNAGVSVHRLGVARRADDTLAAWFDQLLAQHALSAFDLLHAYFITKAGFVASYAGRFLGLPVVVSARGNDLERAVFDPARSAHTLFALQTADAITANAQHLAAKARALAPGRDVSVIPNGVDGEHFCPAPADPAEAERQAALRAALGLAAGQPVIGFVGEARAKKGLPTLLLAFRQVVQARLAAQLSPPALLLVGGVRPGDDEALLRVFMRQNPTLTLIVTPHLPPADLPAYYRLLDVLALPSQHDGLPNALLEGMACGCAIVAAPVGGIPDALQDGHSGLFVPPGDADALAAAMQRLLEDAALRARLGQSARQTVLERFGLAQEVQANLALYAGLLAIAN